MPIGSTLPSLLVVDDDDGMRAFVETVFNGAGWHVSAAGCANRALSHAPAADLILMDLDLGDDRGEAVTRAIRARGEQMPILAFTATRIADRTSLFSHGFDGLLAKPCSAEALLAAASRWHPVAIPASTTRLVATFGDEQLRPLLARLRTLLAASIDQVDDGALAHRIAGVAGTLGFAAVSEAWRAVAEGDGAAGSRAYVETRRALASLDRLLAEDAAG